MADKSRVKLEVGGYNKASHFAVIGEPTTFYLWHRPEGQVGGNSKWMSGHVAFKHYNVMRQLLEINKNTDGFVSYLTDLYHANIEPKISA